MDNIEQCMDCSKNVRTDRRHWRIHITTSLRNVPADYDGPDSQGTFAVGPCCRKRHPHAFREEAWTD